MSIREENDFTDLLDIVNSIFGADNFFIPLINHDEVLTLINKLDISKSSGVDPSGPVY